MRKPFIPKRNLAAIVLMAAPTLALAIGAFWLLHTPKPGVKTPVAINRNSLLPHRYAGPCLNCHRIADIGPVALNRDNMRAYSLTALEQRLLLAGQRVEVPTTSQQLRIPAITRVDTLPHPYVGVCSNCHVILDVHPSRAFMEASMRRARQRLSGLDLAPAGIARAGVEPDPARSRYRITWGYVALPLLVLASVYIVLRRFAGDSEEDQERLAPWLAVHQWAAAAFAAAAAMHWYYSDRGNNFLHLAYVAVVWLLVGGLMLRFRRSRPDLAGSRTLLVAQRAVFVVFIVLLGVGHFLAAFH